MQSLWTLQMLIKKPPPIVKMADAQHHAQLLVALFMDNPVEFNHVNVMKQRAIVAKLNKFFDVDFDVAISPNC
jgi:hypothetical protein